jgi:hypothetical protein
MLLSSVYLKAWKESISYLFAIEHAFVGHLHSGITVLGAINTEEKQTVINIILQLWLKRKSWIDFGIFMAETLYVNKVYWTTESETNYFLKLLGSYF